ncbi:MAG: Mur ligase family protein [Patescibacteria group bacterium]
MYLEKLIKARDNNAKILLLGFGKELQQFYTWLIDVVQYEPKNITIADKNPITIKTESHLYIGDQYLQSLEDKFEMVFKAPGLWSLKPELVEYREKNGPDSIHSSLIFFLEKFRESIIMITGTKGKTTTSTWCKHFLTNSDSKKIIEYCGNTTNISPYQFWTEIDLKLEEFLFVIEISSFQLQDLGCANISPSNAIITNLYLDHLDQHSNEKEYWGAKDNIFKFQNIYDKLTITQQVFENLISRKMEIKAKFEVVNDMEVEHMKLKYKLNQMGDHSWLNMLLAYKAISKISNINEDLQSILNSFEPPKGRLEYIKTINIQERNVTFYNDNTATEPDAVVAAIKAMESKHNSKTILILSGKWKDGNHKKLAKQIELSLEKKTIECVYYFGEVGLKVNELINGINQKKVSFVDFLNNPDSFLNLISNLDEGEYNVLFSPSGSSFDEFKNYIERGEKYLDWINKIDKIVK